MIKEQPPSAGVAGGEDSDTEDVFDPFAAPRSGGGGEDEDDTPADEDNAPAADPHNADAAVPSYRRGSRKRRNKRLQGVRRSVANRLLTWEDALVDPGSWREIAPDILLIPFLKPDFCADLIAAAEGVGSFRPLDADVENNAAPGQEMRLNRIDPEIPRQFEAHFRERIEPALRVHWWPLKIGPVRMPFLLRYSPDTQPALDPHHDAAMVSLAMHLNTGYEGGALTFPRQHWDSHALEVGDVVAFPSRVTHVHWVTPVTAGTRYAMTCWLTAPNETPDDAISD